MIDVGGCFATIKTFIFLVHFFFFFFNKTLYLRFVCNAVITEIISVVIQNGFYISFAALSKF